MTTVEVSVEVEAPPERVWKITSAPENLPHWDRHIESVRTPDGGLGPGVHYQVVMRFMTVRATIEAEVLEWEPPWRGCVRLEGLLDATVRTSIASLPYDRSLLRHEVEYRFHGLFGGFGAKSLALVGGPRLALRHGIAAQKREIEAG